MSEYSGYSGYSSDESDTPEMERETVFEGDGKTKPRPGDECLIHYVASRSDGSVFDSSFGHKPFKFRMPEPEDKGTARDGQSTVVQGLEMGVRKMTLGERAKLKLRSDYAHVKRVTGGGDKVMKYEKGQRVQVKVSIDGDTEWKDGKIRHCHNIDRTYDVKFYDYPDEEGSREAGVKSERIREDIIDEDDNVVYEVELLAINGMYNKYGTYCGYPPDHLCTKLSRLFCCSSVREYEPPPPDEDDSDDDESDDD